MELSEERKRIFEILETNDIDKVVMEFSGGHDEGYADGWEIYSADPTKDVEFAMPASVLADYKNICEDMEEVMLEYFQYFDGQPSAWGEVEWDVKNRRVVLRGEQETVATEKFVQDL